MFKTFNEIIMREGFVERRRKLEKLSIAKSESSNLRENILDSLIKRIRNTSHNFIKTKVCIVTIFVSLLDQD